MSVTAVICAGWAERKENVRQIVRDILDGSVRPDRVLVLNNARHAALQLDRRRDVPVEIVNPETDTGCRGKYVTALFHPADHYLLMDDDTSVGPATLRCLSSWAQRLGPSFVTGYWGVWLEESSFAEGTLVFPGVADQPVQVDAFHGRAIFCSHDALLAMFDAEYQLRVRGVWKGTTGDDILIGLANHSSSWIVPMRSQQGEGFCDLNEHGVRMQDSVDDYFATRDRFTAAALASLGASISR